MAIATLTDPLYMKSHYCYRSKSVMHYSNSSVDSLCHLLSFHLPLFEFLYSSRLLYVQFMLHHPRSRGQPACVMSFLQQHVRSHWVVLPSGGHQVSAFLSQKADPFVSTSPWQPLGAGVGGTNPEGGGVLGAGVGGTDPKRQRGARIVQLP